MRGFTGEYYNGVPVFVRDEYERENACKSECERLGEMLGASYDSLYGAMNAAERTDERLLYNTGDAGRDLFLQNGRNTLDMWQPYKEGYVHEITGEYVVSAIRPPFESFPAWRVVPVGYEHPSDCSNEKSGWKEWLYAAAILAKLLNL